MDLIDRLNDLKARAEKLVGQLQTEEATKNALVMPFLNALGYDVFNPLEVVPEFTADVGVKKGEKVDYAIMRDGKPIILFECKLRGVDLNKLTPSQLYRYFSVTDARFGILTDGVKYQIFSDLESPNKMDSRPFFEFSLLEMNPHTAEQLKKFTRDSFNIESILATASDLKYTKGIKRILAEEWLNPSEEFVRLFTARVYEGRLTQSVKEQFAQLVKKAFHDFVSDHVNLRLKTALDGGSPSSDTSPSFATSADIAASAAIDNGVETTGDEIEAFFIVKSIVREVVQSKRLFMRDTQSYCGVLLDDNNRKPICRMFFNSTQKYIGLLDAQKKVTRYPIHSLDEIYQYAEQLKSVAQLWDSGAANDTPVVESPGVDSLGRGVGGDSFK